MEREVRELFLQLSEIFFVEDIGCRTSTIPIRNLSITNIQCLQQVKNMSTKRSHSDTTTYIKHLVLRIENRMEFSIRATHHHLIAWFQRENVRRSNTWAHLLESTMDSVEWRSSNTDIQHDAIAFSRIVGHRIGSDCLFGILDCKIIHFKVFPVALELFIDLEITIF